MWGISASDYEGGYTAWGGPPSMGPIDGSLVPCAPGGSLVFNNEALGVLRSMYNIYPNSYNRYSFVDAFNPLTGWYDGDSLGIDLGITMVMAENYRTQMIWKLFMQNSEAVRAMDLAGFVKENQDINKNTIGWWVWLIVGVGSAAVVIVIVLFVIY